VPLVCDKITVPGVTFDAVLPVTVCPTWMVFVTNAVVRFVPLIDPVNVATNGPVK